MAVPFLSDGRFYGSITLSDSKPIKWDTNNILSHNGTQTYLGDATSASVLTLSGGNATFSGDITLGDGSSETRTLTLQTNAEKNSIINFKESTATYGFSIGYYGVANDFIIKRHDNSTNGTDVFTLYRENSHAKFEGNLGINGLDADSSKALRIKSQSVSTQSSAIEVMDNSNTNAIIRMGEKATDGGRLHMFDGGVEKIAFYTDGTDNHISAGNLGIGTGSPSAITHIHGGANDYTPSSTGTGLFHVTAGASSLYTAYIGITDDGVSFGHNGSSRYLRFDTNETERMRIASNGIITLSAYGAGYLKTDANGVVSVDTDIIEDTLDSVTDRDATTTNAISVGGVTSTGTSSGRYTGLEVVNTTNAAGTETAIGLGVVQASNNNCDVKLVANRVGANYGSDFYIEQTNSSGNQVETFRITEDGDATFAGKIVATASGTGIHQLKNASTNATVLQIITTGDDPDKTLNFQSDHIYTSDTALHIQNNDQKLFLKGSQTTVGTTTTQNGFELTVSDGPGSSIYAAGDSTFAGDITVNGGDITVNTTGKATLTLNGDSDNTGDSAVLDSEIRMLHDAGDYGILLQTQNHAGRSSFKVVEKITTTETMRFQIDEAGDATFAGDIYSNGDIIFGGDDTFNATINYVDNGSGDHYLVFQTQHNGTTDDTLKLHAQTKLATFSGDLTAGQGTFVRGSDGYALRLDSASSSTDNDLRFAKGGVDYGAIQTGGGTNDLEFYVNSDGTSSGWIQSFYIDRANGNATFTGDVTVGGGDFNLTKQNGAPYINMLWDGNNPTAGTLLHYLNYKVDYDGTHQDWGGIEHRTTSGSAVRTELRFNVKSASGNVQNALTLQGQTSAVPNATFAGDVQINGNLTVTGTSTSVNVEDLNVEQGEITLNYAASSDTSGSADGAGIRIQDAVDASTDATILWHTSDGEFKFSHGADFAGHTTISSGDLIVGDPNSTHATLTTNGASTIPSIKVDDNGYIGPVSETDAMQFESDGDIVIKRDLSVGQAASVAEGITLGGSNQTLKLLYNNTANYRGNLGWSYLQLGNNGSNDLVAGNTAVGGQFRFFVNNTNDIAGDGNPNGTLALTLASTGAATFTGAVTLAGTLTNNVAQASASAGNTVTLTKINSNNAYTEYTGLLNWTYSGTGSNPYTFNLVFDAGTLDVAYEVVLRTGRNGNWRNFGAMKDFGYIYNESDSDFKHNAEGDVTIASSLGTARFSLDSDPIGFGATADNQTSDPGTGSGLYTKFIRRYSFNFENNTTGSDGRWEIYVKVYNFASDIKFLKA